MPEADRLLAVPQSDLSDYFTERLSEQAQRLNPSPLDETCCYLGAMLGRFGRSDRFFAYEDGRLTLRPLAQLYGDAVEARDETERCLLLQQLGDMALFLGALFPRRYARHGIRRDYFVGMGGSAYDYLADNARRGREVFAELASAFTGMLEMVERVCTEGEAEASDEDVLALYRRWLQDRDPASERRLRALGIELRGDERPH
ncbi:MAG: hypothetical protein V2J24_06230 [Pseudomonadales bacterium]|jgi:hypothetical protein|nr:hypothetical protein [Pseudomonadales bacterium]